MTAGRKYAVGDRVVWCKRLVDGTFDKELATAVYTVRAVRKVSLPALCGPDPVQMCSIVGRVHRDVPTSLALVLYGSSARHEERHHELLASQLEPAT